MLTLAILLQIAGLIFTFSLGVAGYVLGPLTVIGGGWLYRHEQSPRKQLADHPPVAAPAAPRRPGWQRFLIGLSATFVVIAAMIALIWRLTSGIVTTADEFFLALKGGNFAKAKSYLSEDFRATTSEQDLKDLVARSALSRYQSASWSTRSIQNSLGTLEGNLETDSGGLIPMKISFVREKGDWKIYTLRKLDPGIQSLESGPTPPADEQIRLIQATTRSFADAVSRKDFTAFHAQSAVTWQKQITPVDLQKAMQSFIDSNKDFTLLDGMQPVIESVAIDGNGTLVLTGSYPTTPSKFTFRNRYMYEGLGWKLVGIDLHVG